MWGNANFLPKVTQTRGSFPLLLQMQPLSLLHLKALVMSAFWTRRIPLRRRPNSPLRASRTPPRAWLCNEVHSLYPTAHLRRPLLQPHRTPEAFPHKGHKRARAWLRKVISISHRGHNRHHQESQDQAP